MKPGAILVATFLYASVFIGVGMGLDAVDTGHERSPRHFLAALVWPIWLPGVAVYLQLTHHMKGP